jgi:hypothetical protein
MTHPPHRETAVRLHTVLMSRGLTDEAEIAIIESVLAAAEAMGRESLKVSLDFQLNEYLCAMEPGYDDSITGFNEAWDVMRAVFEGRSRKDQQT